MGPEPSPSWKKTGYQVRRRVKQSEMKLRALRRVCPHFKFS